MKLILLFIIVIVLNSCSENKISQVRQSNPEDLKGSWILVSIDNDSVPPAEVYPNNVTLTFEADKDKVHGQAWCNTYFGSYSASTEGIIFSAIGSTRRSCERLQEEHYYFQLLDKIEMYSVEENKLTLTGNSHILVFSRAFTK
ncbi:MAG: META domain-containing protein [Ignavibacteriaceae bacterium]|jgi:Heat shock protein|nr:MAG: META domain-containing protein [Chlorobiota bacterium]KXK06414.1 MAG: heat-inducible protein [Chlorobi bacterium OLB4]MBV6399074.1 hypothetical protein [Ignavibacteria bacterium]MCC6885292.1 META domain-containing protein [Ignavibacteriales bacterium]MCE7953305.1 META domain-containing protein [Chlorobi bacterium CHB7]MDL1887277.1 META domain-containing protein [Ignavibacteria bacterium CHB1]MEB2330152.1 META domain-containing protein [Ignavibacteriaceae bacterium]OQY78215.1 MAG: hyp